MKTILLLAVPPLAGAVIGFITNVIAIKMLFRPLKEIRVFGIRLPFTPGILPRQRHKLADNIGAMVERELLTADIIRRRLQRDEVRGGIKSSVSRYTEQLLRLPLAALREPASFSPLKDLVLSVFRGFVSSPVCDECIAIFSGSLAEDLGAGDLSRLSFNDLAGTKQGEKITARVEEFIAGEFTAEAEKISLSIISAADRIYPQAVELLIRFLNRRNVRDRLEEQGRIFLTSVILKLNVFQRFFISTGQYDKTLHDRMPEIIDDLIIQLEELLVVPEIRGTILHWGRETIYRTFSEGPSSQNAARFLSRMLGRQMDKPLGGIGILRNRGGDEVNILIRNFFDRIKNAVLMESGKEKPGAASFFAAFTGRLRERYGTEALSRVLSIGSEQKDAMDSLICDTVFRIADEQIGAALGAINVRAMVSERIDALDMIRVERIILDVTAHQLKWIDVFGALLGFLIGLFQALFSWLLR
ncbi:MAG: DUF445 family protein [Treponema sp.]|jgi:uncharacterized membrane-anchored protein YjiN (DUF445 family)|nr:DUF445 family protein [Treponema sp.]